MKKIYLVIPLLILGCSDTNFSYPASEKKPLSYDAHGETINDPYLLSLIHISEPTRLR